MNCPNCFNSFLRAVKTAEAVASTSYARDTLLKQGVNETCHLALPAGVKYPGLEPSPDELIEEHLLPEQEPPADALG